ncbi:MAG: hypothetical protein K2I00_00010 [Ruminococcus sp.]|nr:hypothetical protein [Ruminococcus sp.]
MKKVISTLAAAMMITSSLSALCGNAAYENYTEEESAKIDADLESYEAEIVDYAEKMGYSTDRFYFADGGGHIVHKNSENNESGNDESDACWQEYHKNSTNIEAAVVDFDYYANHVSARRCLGMSIVSILAHNGIISPSDIQEGKENLIDIEADISVEGIRNDPVIQKVSAYQARQMSIDFNLDMYYHFANYDKEKEISHLLDTARKASEQGKWWLISYDHLDYFHSVAGIGLIEKEFTIGDKTYDNCILTVDSNCVMDDSETGQMITTDKYNTYSCIFVNSETSDVLMPNYFLLSNLDENFHIYALDDYDFMNYHSGINPSDSYKTDVSSLNRVEVRGFGTKSYSIDAVRADGSEYDVKSSCVKTFKSTTDSNRTKTVYYCDGEQLNVQNIGNTTDFIADFTDTEKMCRSSFKGSESVPIACNKRKNVI